MFITRRGHLVLKNTEAGNIDQSDSQPNDFVIADLGNKIIIPGKCQNGDKENIDNYDIDASIDKNNYPDI